MVKARSRDFLLSVCGVLLLGIALVTIMVNLVVKVENISQRERRKQMLKNIELTEEKIVITGKGNFVKHGPRYENLVVSDFNVRFMNKNDKVVYELVLCNNNVEDVMLERISIGNMTCSDNHGNSIDCSNINIDKDFYNVDNKVMRKMILKSNACVSARMKLEYVGEGFDKEILAHIEHFSFNIRTIEK